MRTPNNDLQLTAHPQPAGQAATDRPPRPQRRGGEDDGERRCILTGQHDARAALIRLALSPDGRIVPDVLARAPGRGAWIGVDHAALTAAMGTGVHGTKAGKGKLHSALTRAFKGAKVEVPADLPDAIDEAMQRITLAQLGLAAKAGVLLVGAEKIDQAARSGQVALLLHASDAAEDGRRKRDQSWRVGEEKEGSDLAGSILPVDRTALSVALGRDNVVHVAIIDGAWAERISLLLDRWRRFAGSANGSAGLDESQESSTAKAPVTGDGAAVV